MKRIITILLLICLFCSTGCAKKPEEFSIRNGIKFGMTPEEVIAIEGEENKIDEMVFNDYRDVVYKDAVMGVDTEITFAFDSTGLNSIMYDIDDKIHPSRCEEVYSAINESLREKYGKEAINVIEVDKSNNAEDLIMIWRVPQKDKDVEILHMITKEPEGYFRMHLIRYINDSEGYDYTVKDYQLNADKL